MKKEGMKEARDVRKAILLGILLGTLLLLFIPLIKADIYMGTCEGYVKWTNGTVIPGANVTVTVIGCTSPPANCNKSALTDSGGYYVIANLNLPPYGNVTANAILGSNYGTNTGQADGYQAAYVNITMCESPSAATLTPVADSHYPDITFWFNWTSGASPYATFDQMLWGGSWSNKSSPQNDTNLAFDIYTWGARTCLSSLITCCSAPSYDVFEVYNTAPCEPILQDQGDTNNNTVTLNWSANTTAPCPDADNDSIYYNFKIDSTLVSNATSPQTVPGLSFGPHTWYVQACDPWECSDWASDSFSVTNEACAEPNLTAEDNVCSGDGGSITLEWDSDTIDPDGDPCHDEFVINGTIQDPATSPITVILTDTYDYEWAVRSCDNSSACSDWANSSFIYCDCEGVEGGECDERGGGGGGGGIIIGGGYELVIAMPKEVYPGESFKIKLNLKPFSNLNNLSIEAFSKDITFKSVDYGAVQSRTEANIELKGKVSDTAKYGTRTITIKAYENQKLTIEKPVEIKITSQVPLISLFTPGVSCCLWLWLLILLIITAITIWLGRKAYKKYKEHKHNKVRDKESKDIHALHKQRQETIKKL